MKLVFVYHWSIEFVADGNDTIPFEYESKEAFQFDVLELIKKEKEKCIEANGVKDGSVWYRNGCIDILGKEFNTGCIEDCIEHGVYTPDEWFEKFKVNKNGSQ